MLFSRAIFALPLLASAWAAPTAVVEERGLVPNLSAPLSVLNNVQSALAGPLALIKANPTGVDNVVANLGNINSILAPVGDILAGLININITANAGASGTVSATIPTPTSKGLLSGLLGGLLGGSTVPTVPTNDALKPVAELLAKIIQQVLAATKTIPTNVVSKPAVTQQLANLNVTLSTLLTSLDVLLKGILALVKQFLGTNTTGIKLNNVLSGLFGSNTGLSSILSGLQNILKQ